jgi:hypothetical protein
VDRVLRADEQVTRLLQYDVRYAELVASGALAVRELCQESGLETSGSFEEAKQQIGVNGRSITLKYRAI